MSTSGIHAQILMQSWTNQRPLSTWTHSSRHGVSLQYDCMINQAARGNTGDIWLNIALIRSHRLSTSTSHLLDAELFLSASNARREHYTCISVIEKAKICMNYSMGQVCTVSLTIEKHEVAVLQHFRRLIAAFIVHCMLQCTQQRSWVCFTQRIYGRTCMFGSW